MDGMVGRRNAVYKTKWEGVGGTCKPASTKVGSETAGAVQAIGIPFVPTISGWCGTGKVWVLYCVDCSMSCLPALQDGGSMGKLKGTKPTSGARYARENGQELGGEVKRREGETRGEQTRIKHPRQD